MTNLEQTLSALHGLMACVIAQGRANLLSDEEIRRLAALAQTFLARYERQARTDQERKLLVSIRWSLVDLLDLI